MSDKPYANVYKITIECKKHWNDDQQGALNEVLQKLEEVRDALIKRQADDILLTHPDGLRSLQGWWFDWDNN